MVGYPYLTENGRVEGAADSHRNWKVVAGALTYKGRIYVPEPLCSKVICLFHDNPESAHFGPLWTAELVSRDFYWPAMDATVRKYVARCEVCDWIKAPRHERHGTNIPLPPPHWPWEEVSMDFATDRPESMASAYKGIFVIADRLNMMAIYLPCRKDIDSPELAGMFFEQVISKHSIPDNIIAERGTQFTSRFWNRVCSHMSINHRLLTVFHPQTDGQPERLKQTMEQYLQAFSNYKQDNWVEPLPLVELVYNNSMHASTRMTPFWAVYHRHPEMQFKTPKATSLRSETRADVLFKWLEETHRVLCENLLEAQVKQTKYTARKEITFEVGDRVWLPTRHFRTNRPSKKLDYKHAGPYMVSKTINTNTYKLDLPKTMRNHNVFHASQLDCYMAPPIGEPSSEPHPVIIDNSKKCEVNRILDSNGHYWKLHNLVQWAGYSHVRTSPKPAAHLANTRELVEESHPKHPGKPRWDVETGPIGVLVLLFFSSYWLPVQYKWRRHGFYHPQIIVNGRWTFPVHRISRKDVLGGPNRVWE